MRLSWYARQQDRDGRVRALFAAFVLTLGAAAMLAAVYATSLAGLRASFVDRVARVHEGLVFIAPAPTRAVSRVEESPPLPRPLEMPFVPALPYPLDTASRRASTVDTEPAGVIRRSTSGLTPVTASRARVAAPLLAPSGITAHRTTVTAAQRDSVLATFAGEAFVKRAMRMKPTQAQKDSIERERAALFARARAEGRPVPIPMGGGMSIAFPLFGRGPSREQRRHDSIVHQDNLRRLERLALRAKAKVDSGRRADSIASLKATAIDSMND